MNYRDTKQSRPSPAGMTSRFARALPKAPASSLLALALCATPISAQIVAGWDTFSGNGAGGPIDASVLTTGVTASFVTTASGGSGWNTVDERGASNDGDWGTSVGPPAADTTIGTANDQNLELSNATAEGTITLTITNGSGADIDLDSFHFDSYAFRPKAARDYELSVLPGGAISEGIVYTSAAGEIPHVGGSWDNGAHADINHDLTFLADSTLEDGGTVEFLLAFSNGAGDGSGGHDLWVDNLAVSASAAGADQLAVTITPATATAGTDFSVSIEAQDGGGTPLAGGVTQDTVIQLTTAAGTGVLSNNTATILTGNNSVTISNLQYTVAEDITLIASQVSGDLLVPSVESSVITVEAGPPTVLTAETANDGTGEAILNQYFRINDPADTLEVFAISRDSVGNFISFEETATITLDVISGDILATDLTDSGTGSAIFTAQNLGTANIRVAVSGFTDGVSNLITVEEPQFRFTAVGNGSWGVDAHWLDNVLPPFDNTTDLFFSDEFSTSLQSFLNGDRTVRSLNFTEFLQASNISSSFGIRYMLSNTDNPRDLTFDTDVVDGSAEVNVSAETLVNINLGNVNAAFRADTSENYGDTILADPLVVNHLGAGNLIFSRPIAETGGAQSVTIDASSTGLVTFNGANTNTGDTIVNGGTLRLNNGNAIADEATLVIDGGVVDVAIDERVAGLTLGGVAQPDGEYGSSDSLAPIPDDVNFSGPGTITVGPPPVPDTLEITDIAFTGEDEVTLQISANVELVDIYRSVAADGFNWQLLAFDVEPGPYVDITASSEQAFYILVPALADPPPNSP